MPRRRYVQTEEIIEGTCTRRPDQDVPAPEIKLFGK